MQAIETVAGGGLFLTASMAGKLALMAAKGSNDPLRDLSGREREVLELLGDGKTLAEIADRLNISYRTSAASGTDKDQAEHHEHCRSHQMGR